MPNCNLQYITFERSKKDHSEDLLSTQLILRPDYTHVVIDSFL